LALDWAETLGNLLNQHKTNLEQNSLQILKTYYKIQNNLLVSNKEIKLFIDYYHLYQEKDIIRSAPIDKKLQKILYADISTKNSQVNYNNYYDIQHNIFDKFNQLNETMNNTFINNSNSFSKTQKKRL
jgi:hypothetical protein